MLSRTKSKPTHVQVVYKYFGTDIVSRTKTFMASIAVHLLLETLRTLSVIMNSEQPALCLKNDLIDTGNATNTKRVMDTIDCGAFRSHILLHSTRTSMSFMNQKNDL